MGVWNDLLKSFEATRPPTKSLLLLGGSVKSQNAFIDNLYIEEESFLIPAKKNLKANDFGLGYTYIQHRDDLGELLSTLQIYTLPGDFNEEHKQLFKSISGSLSPSNTLVIPILDYTENPHTWIRSLKQWLLTIKEFYPTTNGENTNNDSQGSSDIVETLPMDIMIAVVSTQTRPDWEHSKFEIIQMYLRVLSLIHGFSLIYTSLLRKDPRISQLVASTLKIETTNKPQARLEPNLVDHTEILVPVGIDSYGKIKTVNDELDPFELSKSWNLTHTEIEDPFVMGYEFSIPDIKRANSKKSKKSGTTDDNNEYNDSITETKRPLRDRSYQEFLIEQYEKRNITQEKVLKSFIKNVQERSIEE